VSGSIIEVEEALGCDPSEWDPWGGITVLWDEDEETQALTLPPKVSREEEEE
jgi:hypothetical protein